MKLALEENHFGILFKPSRIKCMQGLPVMELTINKTCEV